MPRTGNRITGSRAVIGRGSASVTQYIAISRITNPHLNNVVFVFRL